MFCMEADFEHDFPETYQQQNPEIYGQNSAEYV